MRARTPRGTVLKPAKRVCTGRHIVWRRKSTWYGSGESERWDAAAPSTPRVHGAWSVPILRVRQSRTIRRDQAGIKTHLSQISVFCSRWANGPNGPQCCRSVDLIMLTALKSEEVFLGKSSRWSYGQTLSRGRHPLLLLNARLCRG